MIDPLISKSFEVLSSKDSSFYANDQGELIPLAFKSTDSKFLSTYFQSNGEFPFCYLKAEIISFFYF